ncbi:hypothetical protein BGW38_007237 [Lunasporangiospora selenospora]|uniref:TM2 domain-containing protein n=1 Tax=Lunasporangiospora selenospora TaxID=979761 RepID=A0A9P6KGU9_9FUNG|nr:hypothetical protein BGW38_007237 [Lunasporangiospora selenospora]
MSNYGTTNAPRDEEQQALLNGQAATNTQANDTFYRRTIIHVHHHRKRYFALWLLAAVIAISTVLGIHYLYHQSKHGNGGHKDEGEFMETLLKSVARPDDRCQSDRSYPVAILLSIFFGYVGIDRFYLGYIISALLKLATAGGFGIWYIIDIILICIGALPDHNGCRLTAP